MYRIKLGSGEEAIVDTPQEFAEVVRRGVVDSEALIYHQKANRWLPIGSHPHYQLVKAGRSLEGAGRPSQAMPVIPETPPSGLPKVSDQKPVEDEPALVEGFQPTTEPPEPDEPRLIAGMMGHEEGLEADVALPLDSPSGEHSSALLDPEEIQWVELPPVERTRGRRPRPSREARAQDKTRGSGQRPRISESQLRVSGPRPKVPDKPKVVEKPKVVDQNPAEPRPVEPRRARFAHLARPPRYAAAIISAVAILGVASAGVMTWRPWATVAPPTETTPTSVVLFSSPSGSTALSRSDSAAGVPLADSTPASLAAAEITAEPRPARAAVDSTRVPGVAPAPRLDLRAAAATIVPDIRPDAGPVALTISPTAFAANYAQAFIKAEADLTVRTGSLGARLFAPARLASPESLAVGKRALGVLAEAVSSYRGRESTIDAAYADTLKRVGQRLSLTPADIRAWDRRNIRSESAANWRMTDSLLLQMDAVMTLLQGQTGRYQVVGESIMFGSSETARRYGALREWLTPRINTLANAPEATLPVPVKPILRAVGATRLPVERTIASP